jgi:hypothetical protein
MKRGGNIVFFRFWNSQRNQNFFTVSNHFSIIKNDVLAFWAFIAFLFHENLPIIYANIRV